MSATSTISATPTATCVDVKPGKNGYLPPESCDVILAYVPSFAAAVLFCALFGLTLLAHSVQAYMFRKRFCWVIIMGALWELAAMVLRALLTRHQNVVAYYTPSFLLMLLAPLWINAFLYMVVGRMIYFFQDEKKLAGISAIRLAAIFVSLDIIAFIIQAGGGVIASMDDASDHVIQIGLNVYMGGIGLQELFILCFAGLTITLHRQMIAMEITGLSWEKTTGGSMPWRWLFYTIYTALTLITIRIVFRIVEYSHGVTTTSPILRHEVYQYVLDAVPMFLALFILNVFHPGRVLVGPDSEFPRLTRAEKKRLKQEKKVEKAAHKAGRKSNSVKETVPLQDTSFGAGCGDNDSFDSLRSQEAGIQRSLTPAHKEHHDGEYGLAVSYYGADTRYEPFR